MIELIALIIFIISIGAVALVLARKIPVLVQLSQNGSTGIKEHRIFLRVEEKIKSIVLIFEKQKMLHKLLSLAKVVILKIEIKIDHLLHSLRRKAKEQKEKENKK